MFFILSEKERRKENICMSSMNRSLWGRRVELLSVERNSQKADPLFSIEFFWFYEYWISFSWSISNQRNTDTLIECIGKCPISKNVPSLLLENDVSYIMYVVIFLPAQSIGQPYCCSGGWNKDPEKSLKSPRESNVHIGNHSVQSTFAGNYRKLNSSRKT